MDLLLAFGDYVVTLFRPSLKITVLLQWFWCREVELECCRARDQGGIVFEPLVVLFTHPDVVSIGDHIETKVQSQILES
eukprot:15258183-Ditylum_brightwellii.AAC.1